MVADGVGDNGGFRNWREKDLCFGAAPEGIG